MSGLNLKNRKRMLIVVLSFISAFALLIVRIGYIQFVEGSDLKRKAITQQTQDETINSKRGTLYDRNMKVLANSASIDSVSINPSVIQNKKAEEYVAGELSRILELEYEDVLAMTKKKTKYVSVKRKIDEEKSNQIRTLKTSKDKDIKKAFEGVELYEDSKRYYPFSTFASHVIGFTGSDNQGLEGLEAAYDSTLKGIPGRVMSVKNAQGTAGNNQGEVQIDSQDGLSIVSTIDETLQHLLESNLEQAAQEQGTLEGASGMIVNVKTGEILAMANTNSYDLNDPFAIDDQEFLDSIKDLKEDEQKKAKADYRAKKWRNKLISDTYEPGSTFKLFTAAIALEEKLIAPNDTFFCGGSKKVDVWDISCWKSGGHGTQTFVETLQNSCNVAFMDIGARIGTETFYKYFDLFGFNDKTGFDIGGEGQSIFHAEDAFTTVNLATSSFGQSFQVTPLQMIMGVNAIANDGMLVEPRIVKETRDSNGNIVQNFETKKVRQVVSKETSDILCEIMESVVSDGSGSKAYIPGYRVGGKTGTSEKIPRGSKKYIASFIGIAPSNDPEISVLVMLDEPTGATSYGGQIAAPLANKVLTDALNYLGIEQQFTEEEYSKMSKSVPDVRGKSLEDARKALSNASFDVKINGNGDAAIEQMPKPGAIMPEGSTIIIYTEKNMDNATIDMPNLIGKTVGEAKQILHDLGLNLTVIGLKDSQIKNGSIVISQSPRYQEKIVPAGTVNVDVEEANAH